MLQQALVLAAGRGERLDLPDTPKPLVEVGGQPMIVRLLRQMADAGVRRAYVVVGYEGKAVKEALWSRRDIEIELVILSNPVWQRGLGSSILQASGLVKGSFILAMVDHVFDGALVDRMVRCEPLPRGITVMADDRPDTVFDLPSAVKIKSSKGWLREIGYDLIDFDSVDTGLMSATDEIFAALSSIEEMRDPLELTDGVAVLASRGVARVILTGGARWDDVDTPAALIHTELRLRQSLRSTHLPSRPHSDPDPDSSVRASTHAFKTDRPVTTRVVVGQGLLRSVVELGLVGAENATSPVFVFTDQTVFQLYGKRLIEQLVSAGYDVHPMVMPDGEESKTIANYAYMVERVLGKGIDEHSLLISLGGGAVCNVCGLVASTLYRGVDLVHLPTTLMAQCDAAISHKQAVNGPKGKNLVGSYYAPKMVLVDIDVLETLMPRLIHDGMAEVIKHALAQDPSYARFLAEYEGSVRDPEFLEQVVRRNIDLKCRLLAEDPAEHAEGMVLQYGHTVGHPVEHLSGYTLYHGESVALGMMVAARVSRFLGIAGEDLVQVHRQIIAKYGLPVQIPRSFNPEQVIEGLRFNKKYLKEGTRMALLEAVGKLVSVDGEYAVPVPDSVILKATLATMEGFECRKNGSWSREPEEASAPRSPGCFLKADTGS